MTESSIVASSSTIKFKSKNKCKPGTVRSSGILINDTTEQSDHINNHTDTHELSIQQLRELQQLRQSFPMTPPHTNTTNNKSIGDTNGNTEQSFEHSVDEKIKIKQMNQYVQHQLQQKQFTNKNNTTTDNSTATLTDQYKQQLYEPSNQFMNLIQTTTTSNNNEKGYNWLSGISEVPLNDDERNKMIQRNEQAKRKLQSDQLVQATTSNHVVTNYNSNYVKHKSDYRKHKQTKHEPGKK